MELLDRYLQAVKKHLPWKRQDDIIAELKSGKLKNIAERSGRLQDGKHGLEELRRDGYM